MFVKKKLDRKKKNFDELQQLYSWIFFTEILQTLHLPMYTKESLRFLLFCLDLELSAKIKKTWFLNTNRNQVFYVFIN